MTYHDEIMLPHSIHRPTEKLALSAKNAPQPCVKLEWDGLKTLPNEFGVFVRFSRHKKLWNCDLKFLRPTGDKKFQAVGKSPETALSTAWNFFQAYQTRVENSIPHKLDWGLIVTRK